MDTGVYTAANAMLAQFNIENNIADNLANMETPGYKTHQAVLQEFSSVLAGTNTSYDQPVSFQTLNVGNVGQAPTVRDYGLDLSMGSPRHTGSPLDAMIDGNGFFTVQSGGQVLLTRNGNFQRSATGDLVTGQGYPVLDANGKPIVVPEGSLTINRNGQLSVNGKAGVTLGLAQVPTGQPLSEVGGGYYVGPGTKVQAGAQGVAVLQGYLEGSNVDMTAQTTAMISAQRAYEAASKMLQIEDSAVGLVVTDFGKVNS